MIERKPKLLPTEELHRLVGRVAGGKQRAEKKEGEDRFGLEI
jgi:hypothetical protein